QTGGKRAPLIVAQVGIAVLNANFVVELVGERQTASEAAIEIIKVQPRHVIAGMPQHANKYVFIDWFAFKAQPLRLVLIVVRNEAKQRGHLRINPRNGMREGNRAKRPKTGPFAQGD